ncbi:PREDICTED: uncharacterized protein LOC106809351 [Priapulus caudatus]|uniref:Uncharacterized protein LOC106809351 n=1 Tax=Priapulus caudatus TaxID=37621 RepID=A0ABM1E6T0_PRICU|nr:PREDICTED: uncharacterized protein LOC106809351 [Priapulus caudatus]
MTLNDLKLADVYGPPRPSSDMNATQYKRQRTRTHVVCPATSEVCRLPQGRLPSEVSSKLLEFGENKSLARVNLPLGVQRALVTFDCSLVSHAGQYLFRLYEDADTMSAESAPMRAQWPRIDLELPAKHAANTADVTLKIEAYGAPCTPADRKQRNWLELIYRSDADDGGGGGGNQSQAEEKVIAREEFPPFWRLTVAEWILKCSMMEVAGTYGVVYRSSASDDVIARSRDMRVGWSDAYAVTVNRTSIAPCRGHVVVGYGRPACVGDRDVVRLYAQSTENVASLVKPVTLLYVSERRVRDDRSQVTFSCRMFTRNNFAYCFKYVSISSSDAVTEQCSMCLSTLPVLEPVVDGAWSAWSGWGDCTAPCGDGVQNRYRICDDPRPLNGGQFCPGAPVETKHCRLMDCQVAVTPDPLAKYSNEGNCTCGCALNKTRGAGYISSSQKRCAGHNVWIIQGPRGSRVNLTFALFDLNSRSETLRVRDGVDRQASLLLMQSGALVPPPLQTSANGAMLEFKTPLRDPLGLSETGSGFAVEYRIVLGESIVTDAEREQWYENIISVVGISVCAATIVIVVGLVLVHVHKRRRLHRKQLLLYKDGTTNTTPRFTPLSQRSSDDAADAKRECLYVFREGRAGRGGSIPGERLDDSPSRRSPPSIPSPYQYNASPEDYLHDINVFKAKAAREAYKWQKKQQQQQQSPRHADADSPNFDFRNGKHAGKDRHSKQKLLLPDETEVAADVHDDVMQQSIEQNWEVPPPYDPAEGSAPARERRPRPTSLLRDGGYVATAVGKPDSDRKRGTSSSTLQDDARRPESTPTHSSKTSLQSKYSGSSRGQQQQQASPERRRRHASGAQLSPSREENIPLSGRPTPTRSLAATTPSDAGGFDIGMEWDIEYDYGMQYVPGSYFNMSSEFINYAGSGAGGDMETSFDWNMPESEALKVVTPKQTTPTTPTNSTLTATLLASSASARTPLSVVADAPDVDDATRGNQKAGDVGSGAAGVPTDVKSKVLNAQQNDLSKTPPPGSASPKLSAINLTT